MNVLITHESSGVVREAFARAGHFAVSVDILPTKIPCSVYAFHQQMTVEEFAHRGLHRFAMKFDLQISHPDCTFLTNSASWALKDGPYHQRVKPGTLVGAPRREAREKALKHIEWIVALELAPRICIENPPGGISTALGHIFDDKQTIHPHQFGHDASKTTCLYLKNLPRLTKTKDIPPRMVKGLPRWANQTDSGQNRLTPSNDRWLLRAETYPGIADAFVTQWGSLADR